MIFVTAAPTNPGHSIPNSSPGACPFPRSIGIDNIGAGTVDATENWWNCDDGPGSGSCASVTGSGVSTTPWLFAPPPGESH